MNKLLIAVALCAALTACKKEEAAPAADAAAPAAEAAAPAADAAAPATDAAPVADTAAASTLPQECNDYIARAQACFEKASNNVASAALRASFDKVRSEWEASPYKDSLGAGCKAANDAFAQTAATLSCE